MCPNDDLMEVPMAECPNKEKNEKDCSCDSDTCERHGVCCECIRYHRENNGVPACLKK